MRKTSNWQTKTFAADQNGNISMLLGLMLMPFIGIVGAAVDYSRAIHAKAQLQAVVDAAAIAGARLPATAEENRQTAAEQFYEAGVALTQLTSVASEIKASNAEVRVDAWYSQPTVMLGLFGIDSIDMQVASSARSQVENGGVACVLALSPTNDDGLHLQGINQAAANNCWVWVNSTSSSSINADGAARATAQGFCTAGEASGADHFGPAPYANCAPLEDPFEQKFAAQHPSTQGCTHTNLQLKSGTYTLSPGIYCGNTVLKPHADVTFLPGVYVMKDGTFEIQGQASAQGDGVTFFFSGGSSRLIVRGGGAVDFKAPTAGDWAGFVLVKKSAGHSLSETIIQGGGRVNLVGVLYAPEWRVNVSGNGEINQDSQFFAMIADHFYMEGNGRIWINSDTDTAGMPEIMPKIKSGPVLTR